MSADIKKLLDYLYGFTHEGVKEDDAMAELAALVDRAEKAEARLAQAEIGSRQRAMERERAIEERDALLDALQNMCSVWISVCNLQGWDPNHMQQFKDARAVVARATGGRR